VEQQDGGLTVVTINSPSIVRDEFLGVCQQALDSGNQLRIQCRYLGNLGEYVGPALTALVMRARNQLNRMVLEVTPEQFQQLQKLGLLKLGCTIEQGERLIDTSTTPPASKVVIGTTHSPAAHDEGEPKVKVPSASIGGVKRIEHNGYTELIPPSDALLSEQGRTDLLRHFKELSQGRTYQLNLSSCQYKSDSNFGLMTVISSVLGTFKKSGAQPLQLILPTALTDPRQIAALQRLPGLQIIRPESRT
jgi:hypothetical protein